MPLPPTLDPVTLFLQAGPVVQAVVCLLILMSAWGWIVIFDSGFGLWDLKRSVARAEAGRTSRFLDGLLAALRREAGVHLSGETADERRRRIRAAALRRVQEAVDDRQGGLANLAVIASTAPFVGLLGTVLGIMTSFVGIAATKETSLAVVAPGIAEALGATAIGLIAAIPAAFAYNRLAAGFARATRQLVRFLDDDGLRAIDPLPDHSRHLSARTG